MPGKGDWLSAHVFAHSLLPLALSWPSCESTKAKPCEILVCLVCGTFSLPLDRWAMLGQLDGLTPTPQSLLQGALLVPGLRPYTIARAGIDAPIQLRSFMFLFAAVFGFVFCYLRLCFFPFWAHPRLRDVAYTVIWEWDTRDSLSRRYLWSSDLITSSRLCLPASYRVGDVFESPLMFETHGGIWYTARKTS